MINLIKKYMPSVYTFLKGFFSATDNKPGGQSLKKWLSIGFFWLTCTLCAEYTDKDNLVSVIVVLTSMITALIITNETGKYYDKKLDKPTTDAGSGTTSEATG